MPQLPLALYSRSGNEQQPLAVSHHQRRASILLCNEAAHDLGIRPGISVAAARALAHGLIIKPRDELAEAEALNSLAAWAYQFSSQVSLCPPYELLLEVEGSFLLYGGHERLISRLRSGLAELGYKAWLASAPTPLSARSLARCNSEQHIETLSRLTAVLAPLPVSVLDWGQASLDRLAGIGVRRLGDLLRLPRAGLARRFGKESVLYLDRMLGRCPHPQPLYSPPDTFRRNLVLPAEVEQAQALLFALQRLLMEMCGWLQGLGAAVLKVDIRLEHHQRTATPLSIDVHRPSRDAGQFTALLRERLESLQLVLPVVAVELCAGELLQQDARSQALFAECDRSEQVDLLDRLRARLGVDAVTGISAVAEHRPERAWQYSDPGSSQENSNGQRRPLWLLSVPRPLKTINGRPQLQGELRLQSSCERIEAGWWDGEDVARDYYIATTMAGSAYWVYHELTGNRGWYLQGVFE